MKKYLLYGVCSVLIIIIAFFLVKQIPLMIHSHIAQEAHEKIEDSGVSMDIKEHLKNEGFSEYSVMQYSSLEDIQLIFSGSTKLKDEEKSNIKQIVQNVAKDNGFDPHSFNIKFE
ncbi:hypothetical protein [Radiobacillus deserti]|uniref:Uncharacterized protein n=1 Tax=Radiobacillus deserti TaxID=2594883 RepID=A0A516KJJ8_9BACI|nr:hypothetical protein [Radiobacillus deserti]QDP41551.1 hypothetical protein FN924_16040 [Radiobacillus deserti]